MRGIRFTGVLIALLASVTALANITDTSELAHEGMEDSHGANDSALTLAVNDAGNTKESTKSANELTDSVETKSRDGKTESDEPVDRKHDAQTALLKALAGVTGALLENAIEKSALGEQVESAAVEFQRHIAKYDANHDGALSPEELAGLYEEGIPPGSEDLSREERIARLEASIEFIDLDDDGKVTHAELMNANQSVHEKIEQVGLFAQELKEFAGVDEENNLQLDLDTLLPRKATGQEPTGN